MLINATITARVGPNRDTGDVKLPRCNVVSILAERNILQLFQNAQGTNAAAPREFDLTHVTTITITREGDEFTLNAS